MSGNVIVTKVVNRTTFEVDRASYQRTVDRIKQVGKEWDKVTSKMKPLRMKFEENAYTKIRRKQQDAAAKAALAEAKAKAAADAKAAKAQIAAERKLQTIRAKAIRFNTAAANANVTPAQRSGHLQEFGQLTRQYHAGSMALQEYNARVSRLQQTMRQQGRVGMRGATIPVTAKVNKLDTSMIEGAGGAITLAATVALSGKIMTTGQDFESAMSGLTAITGSTEKAAKEFEYLKEQSNRLGLDLLKTSKDYTQFAASVGDKLPKDQMRSIFEGASEWGLVTGASADEQSRALKSLNQMMSKGTVMSEELKGQLSEALPGSVGLFVKALNDMKGVTNLTEKDLFKLMEDGKLFSKDILPHVAKQMKEAARNGGALDKAMKSNRASWQRLNTSMQNAMNVFFTSGFGNELTNAFDSISAAIDGSGGAFEMFGHIAGKIVEGATDVFTELHDTVILTFRIIEYYAAKMGISGEQIKTWGEMAAYAAGVALFAGSVYKLGGAFKWVLTMLNPLTKLLGVMKGIAAIGGIEAASEALGDGKPGKEGKPGKPGTPSKNTKPIGAGRGVNFGLPAVIAAVSLNDRLDQIQVDPEAFKRKVQENRDRPSLWTDIMEAFSGSWYEKQQNATQQAAQTAALDQTVRVAVPTFTPPDAATLTKNGYGNPLMAPPAWLNQPLNVNVNVKVQDGQVKDLVRSEVEANDNRNFNMLMQGGPN
ncbi:tape measure protein [Enterobacter sp. BT855]|uniref:tape measure protein n=3 Tax=Enterobacteriaceae TaxID=543 RepID=UPI001F4F4B6D|nr:MULTISPECIES: tape measure protein [Enterobacter]MCR1304869.1 tape measure protein [Enterobacter sp. FL1277]MCR1313375.1 tape measure protein [Enterobacter sp. BT855]MCR1325235.1 tape measure protein [Enterobacter sp. BT1268]MCR1328886.1 tape measure protein [Enterobacter sp. BT1131]MCR1333837.1 tape measure protein [Enterobacter sp. BT4]